MTKTPAAPQYLHVVTVGTSLLINHGWRRDQPLPSKTDLLQNVQDEPRKHSAELNALMTFIEKGECSHVHLLTTDTPECRLCREVIGRSLHNRGIKTTDANTRDFRLDALSEQDSFNQSLRHFRELVFRVAHKARQRGDRVLINATGGLKAQIAVAALVAVELRLPVYYIHEQMSQPVYLPTAPLDPVIMKALRRFTPSRARALTPAVRDRLEREGLIKVSRRADGETSTVRLTSYAKHLLKCPARG